ncbi:MAG: hypothetical protein Q8O55_05050 [Dehalococcoidales bacterium]|nr:hypothetical protein [Dehalococcoidales bacterium]MDZ4230469.1 hypothetical protein [Dehalococcoidales bacterium]
MIATRRKPFKIGKSKAVTLPKKCRIGESVTMACGGGLALVDPSGEIPEEDLMRFFILYLEPAFQEWWRREQEKTSLYNYARLGRKVVNGA